MSDDLNLTARDRHFVSSQDYECHAFIDAIAREFPEIPRAELEDALEDGKDKIAPSNDRQKLTDFVRDRFKSHSL